MSMNFIAITALIVNVIVLLVRAQLLKNELVSTRERLSRAVYAVDRLRAEMPKRLRAQDAEASALALRQVNVLALLFELLVDGEPFHDAAKRVINGRFKRLNPCNHEEVVAFQELQTLARRLLGYPHQHNKGYKK